MNSEATFYGVLLGVEVTTFSIIAAASFVYLQVIYGQFSYRYARLLLGHWSLIVCIIMGVLTLVFTTSFFLSNSFPNIRTPFVKLQRPIEPLNWPTTLITTFFITLICFGIYIIRNFSILTPGGLAKKYLRKLRDERILYHLAGRYELLEPDAFIFSAGPLGLMNLSELIGEELSEGEINKRNFIKKEYEEHLEDNQKKYELLMKTAKKQPDYLTPVRALALRQILNLDEGALQQILAEIELVADSGFAYAISHRSEGWNTTYRMEENLLEELSELYNRLFEGCIQSKFEAGLISIIESSLRLVFSATQSNRSINPKPLLLFWRNAAETIIGSFRSTFFSIMKAFDSYGMKCIETDNGATEELFRGMGWIGSRLLERLGLEEKPRMFNPDYSNEFDEYFEILLGFSSAYDNQYPSMYPLLYFDAVQITIGKLVTLPNANNDYRIEEILYDCANVFASFMRKAAKVGNGKGAELAAMRLHETLDEYRANNLEKSASQVVALIVQSAFKVNKYQESLGRQHFGSEPLTDRLVNWFISDPDRDTVKAQIFECFIRSNYSHEGIWKFVKSLGVRMDTNFNLMFDENTGEDYAEDDPRRR